MTLPTDSHVHTEWSFDTGAAPGSMERMCAVAGELGIPAVAFTDHLDFVTWQVEPDDFLGLDHLPRFVRPDGTLVPPLMDIDGYLECVDRCRAQFPDLTIVTGVELGQPHLVAAYAAKLRGFGQLQRVLGSLHVLKVGDQFFEPPGLFRLWPRAEVIREYLAEVCRMVEQSEAFEVLAHIDYAVRYWPTEQAGPFEPSKFEEEFRQTLRVVARHDRALELNVGGPIRPWVAQWWSEEGGAAITFGSDAHQPDAVGRNFPEAVKIAEACGFRPGSSPADFWRRRS